MKPILPGAPWLIAHKSMLNVNRPNKITLNGKDYVLWQNTNGEVFALDNVCPHMQAPLSDGWVCWERDTITCPFHALEFDGKGRLERQKTPITSPLEIKCVGDLIWTYGGWEPKLPIPDLIVRRSQGFQFVGVTGEESIQGDFLRSLLINYDYNHVKGTHRELFNIEALEINNYEEQGYQLKLTTKIIRGKNSLKDVLKNPVVAILPKTYLNQFEYSFPSLNSIIGSFPMGKTLQIHVIYPETEKQTKTFVLVFAQASAIVIQALKKLLLRGVEDIVKQDNKTVESLYPRQKAKVKLPNEEIMFYAEKLYKNWSR